MGIMDWKHWVVILAVVILVFGTKKLRGLGADIGENIKGFRIAMRESEPGIAPSDPAPAAFNSKCNLNPVDNTSDPIRSVTE
ncbi:Sec-independent protein translocase protein TatA [Pseudomonas sp. Bi70]|nr:Sec-independent protein translocase protein TatA [Pseudomonas sp. Bi70]